ncbi:cytochrome P450 [Streptomyces sp. NPDC058377]|uniref:cytochrome P450 n=1 Tax=Streptomyces sp. NPDC058377 TaxID=3346468 RepID=UPI00365DEA0F
MQDEAITLLTGAIETTGSTLAWPLHEVTRYPEIERRLRAELAPVCAGRPLTYEGLDRLPYARRVLQESIGKYGSLARGSFLAFGDGRRKCIGENFAWSELQIILATVLQSWPRLELASPSPPRGPRPWSPSNRTR